jgi:Txe/YoeB family toxin of Txe-Axe toxin-antitoxin module
VKTISWQTQDRKLLRRINALIKDIERTGEEGFGKPEPPQARIPRLLVASH